jgi:hypothetical protein
MIPLDFFHLSLPPGHFQTPQEMEPYEQKPDSRSIKHTHTHTHTQFEEGGLYGELWYQLCSHQVLNFRVEIRDTGGSVSPRTVHTSSKGERRFFSEKLDSQLTV